MLAAKGRGRDWIVTTGRWGKKEVEIVNEKKAQGVRSTREKVDDNRGRGGTPKMEVGGWAGFFYDMDRSFEN